MKNIILLFILCVSFNLNAQQSKYISRDTLLYIFKNNTVHDAIYKIGNRINHEQNLDYKGLFLDKELKIYFLKSLDRNELCENDLKVRSNELIKLVNNKEFLKSEIIAYLYDRKRGNQIDSILKSEELILKLKDSVVLDRIKLYKKNRNCKQQIPNLYLLTKIKYRAVYDSIKSWSIEMPEKNFIEELLSFNDPDAQIEFNKKVRNYVKTNGKKESFRYYESIIKEVNTAYVYSKIYELLSVNKPETVMYEHIISSNGDAYTIPVESSPNFDFSEKILNMAKTYKMGCEDLFNEFDQILRKGRIVEKDNFIKKNKETLRKILNDIFVIKQKEEEYWMNEMPFYKKN